jgi:hemolysin activation/secretion protein
LTYLPLSLRWDANRPDAAGRTDFGLSYSPNLAFSGGRGEVQAVAGSTEATGYWHVLGASLARGQNLGGDWKLDLRADGQWASEPLISNEQFGVGGIGGVRGYREGEVFGSTGWRITSELKSPPHRVGTIGEGGRTLTVRGSVFMDYAETYVLDAQAGQAGRTPLWGTGFGGVASIGPAWEARLLFAWPLLNSPTTEAGQGRVAFSLTAQY